MYTKERKAKDDLYRREEDLLSKSMDFKYFYEDSRGWTSERPIWDLKAYPQFCPLFIISKPGQDNWVNSNKLCEYDFENIYNKAIGDWSDYIFFSPRCTQGLMDMINTFERHESKKNKKSHYYIKEEKAKVYQFESSHFKYSLLKGNICKININNTRGDTIEYLIFPFASHQNHKRSLYGLAQLNNIKKKNNNNNNNNYNDSSSSNGSYDSYNSRNNRYNNERHNNNDGKQKWRCDGIYTESGLIKFFQQFSNTNINKDNIFADMIIPKPIIYQECDDTAYNKFHLNSNVTVSDELKKSLINMGSHNNNNNNKNNKNNNRRGRNSFDKYKYLIQIRDEIGLSNNEFVNLLMKSIDEGIKFGKKHNECVLTQVYIDSKFARLYYEPVLYCELKNQRNNKYYKFGLPMIYKKNLNCYEIKGILTTKMAMDNIGLNYPQSRFTNKYDSKWWNSSMNDNTQSFYNKYYNELMPQNRTLNNNNGRVTVIANDCKVIPVKRSNKTTRKNRGKATNGHSGKKSRKNNNNLVKVLETSISTNTHDNYKLLRSITQLNETITRLLNGMHTDISVCTKFINLGRLLYEFCNQYHASLLIIKKNKDNKNNNNNNTLIIDSKNALNGNNFTKEMRWQSFWNILINVSNIIVPRIGKNSFMNEKFGQDALLSQQSKHPQLDHTGWLDKILSDLIMKSRKVGINIADASSSKMNGPTKDKEAIKGSGGNTSNDIDSQNGGNDDIIVKPLKPLNIGNVILNKPTKPPMLSISSMINTVSIAQNNLANPKSIF